MHIAYNGWFWDQPNTGSGQYIRRLLHHLRRVAPDLQMTLVLPPHNTTPDNLPENVSIVAASGLRGKLGKVWFEQRTFPRIVGDIEADLAHVPYWGPPFSSPAPLVALKQDQRAGGHLECIPEERANRGICVEGQDVARTPRAAKTPSRAGVCPCSCE